MAENTSEDSIIREGDISNEDNLEGMVTGSKSLTVLSENAELMALLTSMNKMMKAMSELLCGSGEMPTPKPVDSAKWGQKTNNGSHDLLSDSAESDGDQLLESNKRQKIQDGDEEDTLLDEIIQSMNETEKTDAKISEKLAKIVENRWLNKLSNGQLKEKTEFTRKQELPPEEKRSQQSEVTTTGIINQLDSSQVRDNFESFLPYY